MKLKKKFNNYIWYNFFNDKTKTITTMYCIVAIHLASMSCATVKDIFFSLFLINFRLYYNEQLVSLWNMSMTSYSLCVTKTHVLVFSMTLYLCPILCTSRLYIQWLGIVKKQKKLRKSEKNNWKNQTVKKKPIKILKKPTGSVRFRFYKFKTEKTESNPNWKNRKKPSQNRKNRAKLVWTGFCPKKSNRTETGRFEPGLVFFLNFSLVILFK